MAANPVVTFTDEEKKMLMLALKALERSLKSILSRSQMPLVMDAFNKQLTVVNHLMGKVGLL